MKLFKRFMEYNCLEGCIFVSVLFYVTSLLKYNNNTSIIGHVDSFKFSTQVFGCEVQSKHDIFTKEIIKESNTSAVWRSYGNDAKP